MPTSKKKRAERYSRTRRDHATETAEDYVEAIAEIEAERDRCRAADLARHFSVSQATVAKIITRLANEGLVETEPYAPLKLTARGRRLARSSQQRHALVLEFLLSIGVSEETARIDAEGIEHHVSAETLRQFRRMIDS